MVLQRYGLPPHVSRHDFRLIERNTRQLVAILCWWQCDQGLTSSARAFQSFIAIYPRNHARAPPRVRFALAQEKLLMTSIVPLRLIAIENIVDG